MLVEGQASGDDFAVEHEVLTAARESSERVAQTEQHSLGKAALERLRADVARLSQLSDTADPFAAFGDMRRVRGRIYRLLDLPLWPRERADLHFLLGCLSGEMGLTARRLGYPDAARELIQAGCVYANGIGDEALHGMLLAFLE